MSHLARAVATVAALVTLAVSSVAVAPAAADAGAEADFAARINGARSGRGLAALASDGELTAIARRWSQRMANENRLSHNPNLAKEVTQDWEKLAENVGVGSSVAEIHDAFMNSPSHRANILDGGLTHLGVGVVVDERGQIWVTEVFMRLRGGSGSSGTAPPATTATTAASTTTTRPRVTTTTAAAAPRPAAAPVAAPAPTAPPATTPPAPVLEPGTPPPDASATAATAQPSARLVLVLDGLRSLDRRR